MKPISPEKLNWQCRMWRKAGKSKKLQDLAKERMTGIRDRDLTSHNSVTRGVLRWLGFADTALTHKDQIFLATDEVAGGQRFDLGTVDRLSVELPIKGGQGVRRRGSRPGGCGKRCVVRGAGRPVRSRADERSPDATYPPVRRRLRRASSCSARKGTWSAAQSASTCSRRLATGVGRVGSGFGGGEIGVGRAPRRVMGGLLCKQGSVVGQRPCGHGRAPEVCLQVWPLLLGQGFQNAFGLRLHRQDAFHGFVGEGAITYGPLQSRPHIRVRIGGQQGQHALGLVFAVALRPLQSVQEACGYVAQFGKARLQLGLPLGGIYSRTMRLAVAALSVHRTREDEMASDFLDLGIVDDHLRLGDAYRQRTADVLPGDGIAILAVDDVAVDIDHPVTDGGHLIRLDGQRDQVRPSRAYNSRGVFLV